MVVIHIFFKVGYQAPPPSIADPMICIDSQQRVLNVPIISPETMEEHEELVDIEHTVENRYCTQNGVSPVLCVCTTDPPSCINLDVVREYCWFATKGVCEMDNSHTCNMFYWWYIMNTYNIGGRGVTKKPADCLTAAICCAYPEEDVKYKGYRK